MANGFLTPFLSGALGEYSRQEERNDEIISKIIDSVANKVLNEEIPAEEKLINDAMSYKNQYTANYGSDVGRVLDAAGIFENPTDIGVENALIRFFCLSISFSISLTLFNLPKVSAVSSACSAAILAKVLDKLSWALFCSVVCWDTLCCSLRASVCCRSILTVSL